MLEKASMEGEDSLDDLKEPVFIADPGKPDQEGCSNDHGPDVKDSED